jgi:flagellar motility protein MotE (MotC chaperone)
MIAKLKSPLAFAVLGVLISVALGSALCWRAAGPLIAAARAHRPAPADGETKAKGWDFWTIEIENLSNELKEERAHLLKRSDLLDQREARLASEEKELGKVRADVERLRKEIADKVIEVSVDEAKNLRALAQTYTNLSPKAVVAIFREMDDVTTVKILSLMKPDAIGPIFEEMSRSNGEDGSQARRAAVLSEKLRLMKAARSPI